MHTIQWCTARSWGGGGGRTTHRLSHRSDLVHPSQCIPDIGFTDKICKRKIARAERYREGHLHCESEQTARIAEIKATKATQISSAVIVQRAPLSPHVIGLKENEGKVEGTHHLTLSVRHHTILPPLAVPGPRTERIKKWASLQVGMNYLPIQTTQHVFGTA